MRIIEARERVLSAALRRLSAERGDESKAYYAAEIEYADEMLALAARDLVKAVEESTDSKPIGWVSQ